MTFMRPRSALRTLNELAHSLDGLHIISWDWLLVPNFKGDNTMRRFINMVGVALASYAVFAAFVPATAHAQVVSVQFGRPYAPVIVAPSYYPPVYVAPQVVYSAPVIAPSYPSTVSYYPQTTTTYSYSAPVYTYSAPVT